MSTFQTISKLVIGLTHRILVAPNTGGLEGYTQVSDIVNVVAANHGHAADYAALTHNHDSDYAALTHNHDADYAALTHNHDSDYAALSDFNEHLTNHPSGGAAVVGSLIMWVGAAAPSGWLLCDGTAISRSTYATLFAIIGESFGIGDGSTTFNLPDFRGRVPLGVGQGTGLTQRAMADTGGAETHTIIASELPSTVMFRGPRMAATSNTTVGASTALGVGDNTGTVGVSIPFSIIPPFLGINFIIYGGI